MKNSVSVGDTITLGWENGLGTGEFLVLDVDPRDTIHQLYVQGSNGVTWWVRAKGAKAVSPRVVR